MSHICNNLVQMLLVVSLPDDKQIYFPMNNTFWQLLNLIIQQSTKIPSQVYKKKKIKKHTTQNK